jgi:hypothetical protein
MSHTLETSRENGHLVAKIDVQLLVFLLCAFFVMGLVI